VRGARILESATLPIPRDRAVGQTLHCRQPSSGSALPPSGTHSLNTSQCINSTVISASPENLSAPALIPRHCSVEKFLLIDRLIDWERSFSALLFWRLSCIYAYTLWRRPTKCGVVTWGRVCFQAVIRLPIPRRRGPNRPQYCGLSATYAYTIWPRTTKFGVYGERACFC